MVQNASQFSIHRDILEKNYIWSLNLHCIKGDSKKMRDKNQECVDSFILHLFREHLLTAYHEPTGCWGHRDE